MNQTKRQTHIHADRQTVRQTVATETPENGGNVHSSSETRTDERFTHRKTGKECKDIKAYKR